MSAAKLTSARDANPLPATSLSLSGAAAVVSKRCMAAGAMPPALCRICAITPATKGTACEVPVRSLRGGHGHCPTASRNECLGRRHGCMARSFMAVSRLAHNHIPPTRPRGCSRLTAERRQSCRQHSKCWFQGQKDPRIRRSWSPCLRGGSAQAHRQGSTEFSEFG